ncbi:MFS transporter [Kribbella sp. CA-293567]|uniref:MFS transporter n=1 Tax=Kribbella sp. CA-293567 TaxID=3002436 RepID=UPI0022DCFB2E|nr:MFS transporter [Kribbella sp. CA-293567]WBQ07107.1 MFS transporter [Kribbella sp. CA-293567]
MKPPEADVRPNGRLLLTVLLLGSTLTVMAGAILTPILDLVRRDLDLSETQTGLVLTMHAASLAAVSPFIGRTIDRFGVRGTLSAGLILYGAAGGAGLVTSGYPALLASRLIFGIGAAAVFTGTTLLLLESFDGTARDRAMGWRSSAISLGGLIWPIAGGAVGTISWHAPFAIYLVGVPLGILALTALPNQNRRRPTSRPARGSLVKFILGQPVLILYYLLQLASSFLLYAILIFLPLRLGEVGVTKPLLVALCTAILSAAMTAVGLSFASLRKALRDLTLLRIAFISWVSALAALSIAQEPVLMIAAVAVFGLGMGIVVPTLTLVIGEAAPTALRGRATAVLATITFGGQVTVPLLLGPLAAAASTRIAFIAAAVLAAVFLLILTLTTDRRKAGTLPDQLSSKVRE